MKDDILKEIQSIFEFNIDTVIEFKEVYGFTFVFSTKTVIYKEKLSSIDIKLVGIIYNENEEYYFAPIDNVENIDEIVREYVKAYRNDLTS